MSNKMHLNEVTLETDIVASSGYKNYQGRRQVHVNALKPCGCDGPWLGNIIAIPYKDWTEEMKVERRKLPYAAKCWAIYPVSKSDNYRVYTRSIGWAFGKRAASERLREFIANRNQTAVTAGR
jgi:hypothetical protein